jgi:hypothetical protein
MRNFIVISLMVVGCGGDNLQPGSPDLSMVGVEPGALGAPCSNASQCSFGVCLAIGRCSHACPLPSCEAGWICAPETGQSTSVCQCPTLAAETCNGIDDDCNGIVDDNAVCPGGGACVKGQCVCTNPTGAFHARFVAKQITLPQQRSDFAVDLNGDGKPDNQYGNIVGALKANNSDPQTGVDQQVASGQILLLADVFSSDPQLSSDTCAGGTVTNAKAQPSPDFSGKGSFTVDSSVTPGQFKGALTSATFASQPTAAQATIPVQLDVYLPLFSFDPTTPAQRVPLTAGQLKLDVATGRGQVNGVIKKADVDTAMANVAVLLDMQVKSNPTSSTSKQMLQIFDTGGTPSGACGQACQNPDGSCAKSGDGTISVCEVTTNSLIKNVLAPDVDMFDASGNYAPNPANTDKDSLSVGFAVQMVGAQF